MKRRILMLSVITTMVMAAGAAIAGKGRMGRGAASCNQNVPLEQVREFQKETSTLRDEMMIKRIELQRERAAEKPDTAKIAQLTADIKSLRDQIHAKGEKYGMFADCPKDSNCWENGGCGRGDGAPARGCGNCGMGRP
ncbi:MAG: hypothetical protein Fur0034_00200 [Desulfuromonadia bacterium]